MTFLNMSLLWKTSGHLSFVNFNSGNILQKKNSNLNLMYWLNMDSLAQVTLFQYLCALLGLRNTTAIKVDAL